MKLQPSERQQFWNAGSYVVIGNSKKANFPVLTYRGLKSKGKTVYPVDMDTREIDHDPAFADLSSLPSKVEAAVLEVPPAETAAWMDKIGRAGIRAAWIHEDTETPEALAIAQKYEIKVMTGTCAVMYLTPNRLPHCIHRWIQQIRKQY